MGFKFQKQAKIPPSTASNCGKSDAPPATAAYQSIKLIGLSIACAAAATSSHALDVDVSGASIAASGKDIITIKRLVVPGAGYWDVTFKWDSSLLVFAPQAVTQSAVAQIKISGPTDVNEGSSATLVANMETAGGVQVAINPMWTLTPSTAGQISAAGVFTAASVNVDLSAVATATYSYQGTPLAATYAIKVVNVPAPTRLCSGVLEARTGQTLTGDFTVQPDNRKINIKVTANSGNPYFFYTSLFLIQGTNTADVSVTGFDADSAVLVPSGGWSGYGQLVSPGYKEGVIAAVPTSIDLTQPFEIRYTGISTAGSIRC